MPEKLIPYDPAEALTSNDAVDEFMRDAFESGDAGYIAHALGVVARTKGMTGIAKETGKAREALYRSFASDGNPTLKSVLAVMQSLGFELTVKRHNI
ncbi:MULTISPECIES: addiction module antidote protein [Rhizobium]|uniref:Putative addiction module antidote protein n=1 Tax=Rhizobium paranaense TaxID=1650438 RepID=A0A7W8XVU8_9HYPH|nr:MULTISPECIES: addiction module antidote protein [Rhizobium]MBB5576539.1 putative addiction module antidote protein [Rhizobium paranaense]PST62437.1 putative addiction module antidote protein [Rhizobium sp. SEMIA4064]